MIIMRLYLKSWMPFFGTFSRFQLKISVAQRENNSDTCQSSIYGFWLSLWHYISKKILCKEISHFLLLEQFRTVNPRDCSDVPVGSTSGVYRIYPNNSDVIDVYCNMDIDGGGWTVCRCKRNLCGDGHQFHKYQQNEQSPLLLSHWIHKDHDIWRWKYRSWPGTDTQMWRIEPVNGITTVFSW